VKLNLGCGTDIKQGFLNVDNRELAGVGKVVDLSKLPWPWENGSVEHLLMLDFLEHFPYRQTNAILNECWRIMKMDAILEVQVPDFTHCGQVILNDRPYMCNRCGWEFPYVDKRAKHGSDDRHCGKCGQTYEEIRTAAVHRLYGGQDYPGNFHYTAFTEQILTELLESNGFGEIQKMDKNENGETYWQNWNLKLVAKKTGDIWGNEP